jgi:hypothetical protein
MLLSSEAGNYKVSYGKVRANMGIEAVLSSERPSWGGLDILTHIPVNEIVDFGIPYCKAYLELVMKPSEKPAVDKFWSYFEKEW